MKIETLQKKPAFNTINALKATFLFLITFTVLACNDDPKSADTSKELVGEWRRSDYSNEFEYKLIFNSNNSGIRMQREGNENQGISSALTFNWTITNNVLKLDFDGDVETTEFSINDDGQLYLNDITDLYFTKVN
tara:strand:- start:105 stop:509 length:405 start_codon:yes stop_codon:yes gene_type:complete